MDRTHVEVIRRLLYGTRSRPLTRAEAQRVGDIVLHLCRRSTAGVVRWNVSLCDAVDVLVASAMAAADAAEEM